MRREVRNAAKVATARGMTFQQCAERYIAAHELAWRNAKHRAQWSATLASYVYPTMGQLPVAAIDTALVLKVLEPMWTAKPETGKRVRGRVEAVLDWASAREFRSGDNPARWRGHLDKLLPSPRKVRAVRHHPALPYADVPAFVRELRERTGVSPLALEFTILTAARTAEVIGATWDEFNLAEKTWTVPAVRMKAGKEHKVPLSERALEILSELPREEGNRFMFVGASKGKPLSNMAMLELMKGLRPGYVPHGFRSSFRDWAAERTNFAAAVAERALAHTIKDKTEAAYERTDLFERRRRLMRDWARYCGSAAARAASNVVGLRAAPRDTVPG